MDSEAEHFSQRLNMSRRLGTNVSCLSIILRLTEMIPPVLETSTKCYPSVAINVRSATKYISDACVKSMRIKTCDKKILSLFSSILHARSVETRYAVNTAVIYNRKLPMHSLRGTHVQPVTKRLLLSVKIVHATPLNLAFIYVLVLYIAATSWKTTRMQDRYLLFHN